MNNMILHVQNSGFRQILNGFLMRGLCATKYLIESVVHVIFVYIFLDGFLYILQTN